MDIFGCIHTCTQKNLYSYIHGSGSIPMDPQSMSMDFIWIYSWCTHGSTSNCATRHSTCPLGNPHHPQHQASLLLHSDLHSWQGWAYSNTQDTTEHELTEQSSDCMCGSAWWVAGSMDFGSMSTWVHGYQIWYPYSYPQVLISMICTDYPYPCRCLVPTVQSVYWVIRNMVQVFSLHPGSKVQRVMVFG